MTNQNPLMKFQRQPEIYTKLPSGGRWWDQESLNYPENEEFAVYAMTGKDEMALKSPEGLFNGDSTVQIIQSCVPNIKNAWSAPIIDIDHLFIAIRIASIGHEMDTEIKCPKCDHYDTYTMDLRSVLEQIKIPNYDEPVEIVDNVYMYTKPGSYRIANLNAQEIYQQRKALQAASSETITDQQREQILKESVYSLTELSVGRLSEFIEKIVLPEGEIVNDTAYIKEFIENVDRKTFKKIQQGVEKSAEQYVMPSIPFKCTECGHEDSFKFEFDPANFFETDSQ